MFSLKRAYNSASANTIDAMGSHYYIIAGDDVELIYKVIYKVEAAASLACYSSE